MSHQPYPAFSPACFGDIIRIVRTGTRELAAERRQSNRRSGADRSAAESLVTKPSSALMTLAAVMVCCGAASLSGAGQNAQGDRPAQPCSSVLPRRETRGPRATLSFTTRRPALITTPFLTELDSRAAVKGSRDPLGIQPIWTRLGRHVIGNLTTVSNSVRDFTTLLLGYHFAEQLAEELGPGTELATFLKWEQLAAYSRAAANEDYEFRGTERVRRNLADDARVPISDDRSAQILGNQKIYGLWGLYTSPARASGLVEGDPPRLTPEARDFVERHYLPQLQPRSGSRGKRLRELLRAKQSRLDVAKSDAPLVEAIGQVLRPQLDLREREFFREHLRDGGPQDATSGRQRLLARLLTETPLPQDVVWSPALLENFAHAARDLGDAGELLALRLHRIRTSESVLAPAAALFNHLLGLDGQPLRRVTQRLIEEWGPGVRTIAPNEFEQLRSEIAAGDGPTGDRWTGIAGALAQGDYRAAVELLLAQNHAVMATRGGAAWIELRGKNLHVRFREEQGSLPKQEQLATLWRFPYFLESLRKVADAVRETVHG